MIHWFDSVPSTMPIAAELAAKGCESMTVVVADEQTAGQGRYGRSWHSVKGSGLYFSVVLRLPVDATSLPALTLALGLAVREAIHGFSDISLDIRWPNDLLAGDRKCAGILTQMQHGAVIAGIGINVNQQSFPPDLRKIATSVRIESGHEMDMRKLLDAVLKAIEEYVETFVTHGKEAIFRMFMQASTWAHGKHVVIEDAGVEGVTEGLDENGFLIVRTAAGQRKTIVAGGIRAARA
jgi:BirA family transcriptional regulator, biotin operon repressor / biotin---[acetyl-CoA-carboxylase] ligase